MTPIASARGRLFTAIQAAQFLGVSTNKVRKLIARGALVAVRSDSGRLEGVYEKDAEAWQARCRREVAPARSAAQVGVDERMRQLMPAERAFG